MIAERERTSDRHYSKLTRLLIIADAIASYRNGAPLNDVWRAVCDGYGQVCRRTVYRDLQFLEGMGFVLVVRAGRGQPKRWQWVRESIRGAVMLQMAQRSPFDHRCQTSQ